MSETLDIILVFVAMMSAILGIILQINKKGSKNKLTQYLSVDDYVFVYRLPFSFFFIISGLFMITIGLKGYM